MHSFKVEKNGRGELVIVSLKEGRSICIDDGVLTRMAPNEPVYIQDAAYPEYKLAVPEGELFELLSDIKIAMEKAHV